MERMPRERVFWVQHSAGCSCEVKSRIYSDPILKLSPSASLGEGIIIMAFDFPTGLNSEKVAALIQKLNSDPQFVLAQNVGTTHDLLDICLKRATVQGAQHVFQHVVPQEGKPVTNQKSSGEVFDFLPTLLTAAYFVVLKNGLGIIELCCIERTCSKRIGTKKKKKKKRGQAQEHYLCGSFGVVWPVSF